MDFSFQDLEKQFDQLQQMRVRNDFASFVKNTVHNYIGALYLDDMFAKLSKFMDDVVKQRSPKLILNLPPRHLKSETASIRLPLFFMLNNNFAEIIVASANQDLANKFSRAARDLMNHEYVKKYWPDVILENNNKSIENFSLSNHSQLKSCGAGGTLNGYGCHIGIIDDVLKNSQDANSSRVKNSIYEWFETVASKRLAPGGGIIVIQTRWAEDDLSGRLIKNFPKKWQVVKYKSIAEEDESFRKAGEILHPNRFTYEEVLGIKETTSPQNFQAMYQQEPRILAGNLFRMEYFDDNRYSESQLPDRFDMIISSYDLPFSDKKHSDFVAGVTLGLRKNKIYLLNLVHGRFDFICTQKKILEECKKYRPNAVLIEARANGQAIIDSLKNIIPGLQAVHPQNDKISRATSILPLLESGQVIFPRDNDVSWFLTFSDELLGFPRAPHDDIVDAFCQGVSYLQKKMSLSDNIKSLDFSGLTYSDGFKL